MWLPDTGYGKLAAATEDYLRRGLVRATAGNTTALVVVYCQADCWMSWNAAKRILTYGYSNVAWYPEGTDGWERAGLALTESQPEPRAGEAVSRRIRAEHKISKTTPCKVEMAGLAALGPLASGDEVVRRHGPTRSHPAGDYSISCWIVRPSANSRWSIAVGTSQTNLMTFRRSSKIRVCQTS